jgi:hypothetical protein
MNQPTQRNFITGDVDAYCEKVDTIIAEKGSKSTLKRLEQRMDRSFSELKEVTQKLLESEEEDPIKAIELEDHLNRTKRKIEDYQDHIAENLEARADEASSVSSRSTRGGPSGKRGSSTHQREQGYTYRKSAYPPLLGNQKVVQSVNPEYQGDFYDDNLEDKDEEEIPDEMDERSIKADEAEIKYQVAALRVLQEKQRFEEERHLREAERQLLLKKQQDEAERAKIEGTQCIEKTQTGAT